MDLSSFKFFWWAPYFFISATVTFRPFKVIQGHWFWYQSKGCMRLPISLSQYPWSYLAPFRRYCTFFALLSHPYSTISWGCSRWTRSPMFGPMWACILSYSAVKLFSKYSNLCAKTLLPERHGRTDGQTDRRIDDLLWYNRALRSIAR